MKQKPYFKNNFDSINERILNITNFVIGIAFIPALISSISRITQTGFKYIYGFHILIFSSVWVLYFLRKAVKLQYRMLGFIIILIALAVPGIPAFGIKGEWGLVMLLYSFLTGLFYGRKAGFVSIAFSFLYLSIAGYLFLPNHYSNGMQGFLESGDLIFFIFRAITIIAFSLIFVFSISKYREYFIATINDLFRAKEKVETSEAKFKQLSNLTFEGILIHDKGVAIDVNLSFANMFGYSRDELLGKNLIELLILKDDRGKILENLVNNYTKPFQLEGVRKDKTIFPIEIEGKLINGEKTLRVSAVRDITLRKKAEFELVQKNQELLVSEEEIRAFNEELMATTDALRDSNIELEISKEKAEENAKGFKSLFENSPISLWDADYSGILTQLDKIRKLNLTDYKGYLSNNPHIVQECLLKMKVIDVNKAALNMLKAPDKESFFSNIDKLLNKKSFEFFIDELEALLLNEKEFSGETELVRFDGKVITVISKVFITENTKKIITAVIDITERKLAEKELVLTKEKAEESDQLKTEFFNNMSHEVRTPLNGILGFSSILDNPELTYEKRKNYINIIQSSSEQLLRIIDDIIEISQLGTKQVKIKNKEICLNHLLLELFSIFDIKAKENKTPLYLKKELSDKESIVLTDKLKLNKILSNLLENALKFTNQGFIEFGYSLVETYGRTSLQQLQIYVKDTGIGIAPDKQQIIFERFSQEEKELSQKAGGLGLGLSIAKENAELLGGNITLKSEKGKGTTFFVTIPYNAVNLEIENSTSDNEGKIATKQDKYTFLIVEDEEVNYLYLETLLENEIEINCTIQHAKNGKEAVEMCKDNNDIDFVLMDLKMPVLNGFEATKLIKEFRPDLTIVAQTAYSAKEDIEKAKQAGCDDFISKPISAEDFNEIIYKYLKK
ncbi:MAG: ATP-binding protein [Bacteroidota bacterium]